MALLSDGRFIIIRLLKVRHREDYVNGGRQTLLFILLSETDNNITRN